MMRRARLASVVAMLLAGAIGLIGSTQTWIAVALADGAAEPLAVPGAEALPVLTPLSLAVLALGAALSIVGRVLRYAFGALAALIGLLLGASSAQIAFAPPLSAVASTVTAASGIAGTEAIEGLVESISLTPWPFVTTAAQIVLLAAGVFVLATGHRWAGAAGRRYRTAADGASGSSARPHDAVDSWDDLSRGDDPTA